MDKALWMNLPLHESIWHCTDQYGTAWKEMKLFEGMEMILHGSRCLLPRFDEEG